MPPDWPNRLSEEEIGFSDSARDWGVLREDILEVLQLPKHRLGRIAYGKIHTEIDRRYGGRSTIAVGKTYAGVEVELGLRLDNNNVTDHVWLVFHAEYI